MARYRLFHGSLDPYTWIYEDARIIDSITGIETRVHTYIVRRDIKLTPTMGFGGTVLITCEYPVLDALRVWLANDEQYAGMRFDEFLKKMYPPRSK